MFRLSSSFRHRFSHSTAAAMMLFLPVSAAFAASYSFVDGRYMLNSVEQYHENDTDSLGNPVHMDATDPGTGYGYILEAAAAVNGGTADDGTPVPPMTLKAYTELGAIAPTTDQVQLSNQAYFIAEFDILEAGTQSFSLGWDGVLYATGNAYAWYSLRVGFNRFSGSYQYTFGDTVVEPGQVFVDESHTLDFFIPDTDVGRTYSLQIFLTTNAELRFGGGSTTGAYADFYDSLHVTGWSDGLSSLDGITPGQLVPVPPAVWLFSSGLLGLIGIAKRKKAA